MSPMPGYIAHHKSALYDNIRADYYRNDPYVWFSPYLWSFCHLHQNPRITEGMTVLWVSHADENIVCDLVFVVGAILPYQEARERYIAQDTDLAARHFIRGEQHHPEVWRPEAKTYVADMARSYIPHPAVPIADAVDRIRQRERPGTKLLTAVFRRPSAPLRIAAMDELEQIVRERAQERLAGVLGPGGWSPGQEEPLVPVVAHTETAKRSAWRERTLP